MTTRDDDRSGLLMLSAVTATCHDCDDERLLVPVDDGTPGEFCCTTCDAAVYLLLTLPRTRLHARPRTRASHAA